MLITKMVKAMYFNFQLSALINQKLMIYIGSYHNVMTLLVEAQD